MKTLIVLLSLTALSSALTPCAPNVCDTVRCAAVTETSCKANGGRVKKAGGWCGCCDLCVTQLGEGDDCSSLLLLGAAQTKECGAELKCDVTSKQCIKKSCSDKKSEIEATLSSKIAGTLLGSEKPTCSDDGGYAGKQCKGSQCFCVNADGQSIGYEHNRWETDDKITCQCARDKYEYMKLRIIGRLFHCTDQGDYHPVQCHGSVCFCADRKTGKQVGNGIHISGRQTLKC